MEIMEKLINVLGQEIAQLKVENAMLNLQIEDLLSKSVLNEVGDNNDE